MEKNQDHMSKYLQKKFTSLQEKQFTVPKLVGEGLQFEYLGEYLEEQYYDSRKNFRDLNDISTKTQGQLDKLQEFVEYQLNQSVPERLKDTQDNLSHKIDKTIEDTQMKIERHIKDIEDVKLPEHRVHIQNLEANMNVVKNDIHMLIEENAENTKSTINSAFVLIERLGQDLN